MSLLQSIFLGIVQGLTEFLPVSSSGHLAILQNFFKIDTGSCILFDILLHIGTLLVVFVVYWKDIWKLILESLHMAGDIFCNLGIFFKNKKAEEKTKSGLILAASAQEKPEMFEVVEVGPGGMVDGNEVKMTVAAGDRVIVGKYSGTTVKVDGEEYSIVRQGDILAVVE